MSAHVECDVRGRVAGDRNALERQIRNVDRFAALEQVIRSMRSPRHTGGSELGVALEAITLTFRHVDGRARTLGEVGYAPKVVEMPMRDQDRGAARTELFELNE